MQLVRMKITSWRSPECHRTVEFSEGHSLYDVHRVIQREFQLDDDHLWAFFLSGEEFDHDTEFGTGDRAGSPGVKLSELSLEPGMQIAYVFDLGDELRHDVLVEAVEEADKPLGAPRVVERAGTPPPQYPDFDEEDEERDEPAAEESVRVESFRPELLADIRSCSELLDRTLDAPATAADRELGLRTIRAILDACPDGKRLHDLCQASEEPVDQLVHELFAVLRECGPAGELEELEWRWARLPSPHGHDHGFDPRLVVDTRWALLRLDRRGKDSTALLRHIPTNELERICDAILDACPDATRVAELQCELQDDGIFVLEIERIILVAPTRDDPALLPLLGRVAAVFATPGPFIEAAKAVSLAGQHERARSLLARIESGISQMPPLNQIRTAVAFERAQAPGKAEEILRGLLARRWLSGQARREAVAELTRMLKSLGRGEDADKIVRLDTARKSQLRAEQGGTDVRSGAKVGRNDPCPCGSGKKAKKCCGATA